MAILPLNMYKNCKYLSLLVSEGHDDRFMSEVSLQKIICRNYMNTIKEVASLKEMKRGLVHRFQKLQICLC
jgi:hypothetical protein